jgi:hypothetical protein
MSFLLLKITLILIAAGLQVMVICDTMVMDEYDNTIVTSDWFSIIFKQCICISIYYLLYILWRI